MRTPGLRDPGASAAYLHDASNGTLEHVLAFYRQASNFAPALATIDLDDDVQIIIGFRRALSEDDE